MSEEINPYDTTPRNEEEAWHDKKVQACIEEAQKAIRCASVSLPFALFVECSHLVPNFRLELPEIDGIRHGLFFYTINGEVNGQKFCNVIFDQAMIMASAANRAKADMIAREGLFLTMQLAQEACISKQPLANFGGLTIEGGHRGPIN